MKRYTARPTTGYLIEPLTAGPTAFWDGHHATNPSALRLSCDTRVFLGYRAGGWDDRYMLGAIEVWSSHLGMAVLNREGNRVDCRLPLPIMELERGYALPQTAEEYEIFKAGPHNDKISVLHDFRLWEDGLWLYCIYHEGSLSNCFDCIVRMKTTDFLKKIERSIALARKPVDEIRDEWRALWWAEGVWQPCGINGTNRIYGSQINKNDIVFIRLADGSLRMIHRPIPDNSILDTKGCTCSPSTEDGILTIGTIQQSVRPGCFDNSHIGNNGMPSRAQIDGRQVYIDVMHSVQNYSITEQTTARQWDLEYFATFRVLDYETGEMLYYSDAPIFESDEPWRQYSRDGAWISKMDHLRSVMFVGGQCPADSAKTGLDDKWYGYVGVGDTAIALAEFTIRDLLPAKVISDIGTGVDKPGRPLDVPVNRQMIGPVAGWEFSVRNNPQTRRIEIVRELKASGEKTARAVNLRPGYVDAYAMWIEEKAVLFEENVGWIVETKLQASQAGAPVDGILILDQENPERIFYRTDAGGREIPLQTRKELAYIYEHQPMARDVIKWLERKAAAVKDKKEVNA
jgi:hypothetical protein